MLTAAENSTKPPDAAPSITLVVLSYNQGRYLKEAIAAAFAQTHAPLEILISDDCSTDDSRDIIAAAVAAYDGPHSIRTNFNPANLGIVRHINRTFALLGTEYAVLAAGDDISVQTRVSEIAEALRRNGGKAFAVFSDVTMMDEQGVQGAYAESWPRGQKLDALSFARKSSYINGATAAYSRSLIDTFGELDPKIWAEDSLLPFRALLLGDAVHIPRPLVLYRRHQASMTGQGRDRRENVARVMGPMVAGLEARLADLDNEAVARHFSQTDITLMRELTLKRIRATQIALALNRKDTGALIDLANGVRRGDVSLREAAKLAANFRLPGLWNAYLALRRMTIRRGL